MRGTQGRTVVKHDLDALGAVVAAIHPALQRGRHEACRDVGVCSVAETGAVGPDGVLEHRRADVVPVDDRQVGRGVELTGGGVRRLQYLGVLVVDHRLGGVYLALQQGQHVEALLYQVVVATGIHAGPTGTGQELELVAPTPVADNLPGQVGRAVDARIGPRDLKRARTLEYLRHVDDVHATLTRHQRLGHPGHGEVHRSGGQLLLRSDVHTALVDGHIQAVTLVDPIIQGGVVAGELGLGDPLQLQRHLVHRVAVTGTGRCLTVATGRGEQG